MIEPKAITTKLLSGLDQVFLMLEGELSSLQTVSPQAVIRDLRERERAVRKQDSSSRLVWEVPAAVQLLHVLPSFGTGDVIDMDAVKGVADKVLASIDEVWTSTAPVDTHVGAVEGALDLLRQRLRDQTTESERVAVTRKNVSLAAAIFLLTGASRRV